MRWIVALVHLLKNRLVCENLKVWDGGNGGSLFLCYVTHLLLRGPHLIPINVRIKHLLRGLRIRVRVLRRRRSVHPGLRSKLLFRHRIIRHRILRVSEMMLRLLRLRRLRLRHTILGGHLGRWRSGGCSSSTTTAAAAATLVPRSLALGCSFFAGHDIDKEIEHV